MHPYVSLIVVERRHCRDAGIERGGYRRGLATARHRAQHHNSFGVDVGARGEEVHRADNIPRGPGRVALAGKEQLLREGVPRSIGAAEPGGILDPFAIAWALHDEHGGAGAGPQFAHVVQFALRLRIVLTVDDEDGGYAARDAGRQIEVRRHPIPGTDLKDRVLQTVPVALVGGGDARGKRRARR